MSAGIGRIILILLMNRVDALVNIDWKPDSKRNLDVVEYHSHWNFGFAAEKDIR
jgi:hypothetical protein